MRLLLNLFVVSIPVLLFGQSLAYKGSAEFEKEIEKYILKDQLILQFNPSLEEVSRIKFMENVFQLDYHHCIVLRQPDLLIVRLNTPFKNYEKLKNFLTEIQSYPEVNFASFMVKNEKGQKAGILETFFIKLKKGTDKYLLNEFVEANHISIIGEDRFLRNVYHLNITKQSSANALELCMFLKSRNLFQYAEPNLLFSPIVTSSNDPMFFRQWHLENDGGRFHYNGTPGADLNIDSAWTISRGDSSIKVVIMDSGIDTLHPDLIANLLPGYDATGGNSKGFPNTTYSSDGHGTSCAGIVAAVADNNEGGAGVAPNCKIIPVKVFYYVDTLGLADVIPISTSAWFADGIGWANHVAKADVISNSWGVPDILFGLLGGPISLVEDAINDAASNGRNGLGMPQLFSTGNDNGDLLWPSRLANTIAVTATSMCDERKSPSSCDGEDWGGNYGELVDVGAPGVKIATTDMRGGNGFSSTNYTTTFNGTSAACPNAAGVVALILSIRPDFDLEDIRYVLGNSADKVGGYDYSIIKYAGAWSNELGFGRVDAYDALKLAQTYTGVKEHKAASELKAKLFPNPVNSKNLHVSYTLSTCSDVHITVLDLDGKALIYYELGEQPQGSHIQDIRLKDLKTGMYFLKLSLDHSSIFLKFIVAKA